MAVITYKYNVARRFPFDGSFDNPLYLALLTSSFAFDATDTIFADVSANEVVGSGYVSGGFLLANPVVSYDTLIGKLSADPISAANAVLTFRYAVTYLSGTINGLVNPLVAAYLLDDTPADIITDGNDLSIIPSASGYFKST